jgi:hypothetical protein
MAFLHRFFFFSSAPVTFKTELYISSGGIDFLTYHKQGTAEGTSFHVSNIGKGNEDINHIVDTLPEICNNVAFNGLFFKCTAEQTESGGGMRKFTAWINPQNISHVRASISTGTIIYFRSGRLLAIANTLKDFMKGLIEHNKKYSERRRSDYGKKDSE